MCGFTGFLRYENFFGLQREEKILRQMADAISHRGPDSDGFWADPSSGINLAHRRLAIIDLSPAGSQPMTSVSGRYILAFNGEIYNHLRMRSALEGEGKVTTEWRGHSDTETLLAAIEAWGLEATLQLASGMFALALWDRHTQTLTLARDRMGEKPLYYGWQGIGKNAVFLFGSELSALRKHPSFDDEISRNSLALLMRHNCIGGNHSIYKNIQKLLPGSILTVSRHAKEPRIRAWWSSAEIASNSLANQFNGTPEQAVDGLHSLLSNAVGQQMASDVPLGAFLSGGVDSSTIVALMQAQSNKPVRTFSIGFHESGYNEAEYAKGVAKHLGTDHTELYVTPAEALAVIPKIPTLYSEPFADSSQIPTYLVSQLARPHVKVSLSGDAGDELFCGYTRYQMTERLWRFISRLPPALRNVIAGSITAVPLKSWDKLAPIVPLNRVGEKLYKGAAALKSKSIGELHLGLSSHWENPADVVLNAVEPSTVLSTAGPNLASLGSAERMMLLDILSYLPDDILTKVDRAAMGVGLETRVPFLDERVVKFAWSLPLNYKLRNGVTKWPIRQVLYRHVPRKLIERPKMGFGVPIDTWLRGPLKNWAEALLDEGRLRREGYFNPAPIREKWEQHLSGKNNWQYQLWNVLMFQAWLEEHH
jgi:asparagine synthase (glutamine-hydrolysing)